MTNEIIPIEVFAGTSWEADMLKTILSDNEIESFIKDELTGRIMPFYAAAGGNGAVKVMVPSIHLERATKLVEEFKNNITEES